MIDIAPGAQGDEVVGAGKAFHRIEHEAFIVQPLIGSVDDEAFEDTADSDAGDDQCDQGGDGGERQQPSADRSWQQPHRSAVGASAVSR